MNTAERNVFLALLLLIGFIVALAILACVLEFQKDVAIACIHARVPPLECSEFINRLYK